MMKPLLAWSAPDYGKHGLSLPAARIRVVSEE